MTKDNNEKRHLHIVEPEQGQPEEGEYDLEDSSTYAYDKLSGELTEMYFSEWEEYLEDEMGRDDFIRTVLETDDLGAVHPVIAFDSAPAPTSKRPEMVPEKYGLLNLANLTIEEEDTLFWCMECEKKEYQSIFVPKKAIYEIESLLHKLMKQIIEDGEARGRKDFDPTTVFAFVRELRILFNNEAYECGLFDEDPDEEELYDDDFDDEDFDDEDMDDEGFDDENLNKSIEEDLEGLFGRDDIESLNARIEESIENSSLTQLDFGRYKVTMLLSKCGVSDEG